MKGIKYRYDEKKLAKNSSLKKKIATYLATRYIAANRGEIDLIDIMANGLKFRPFSARPEKDLIKLLDEEYMKILKSREEWEEALANPDGTRYYKSTIESRLKEVDSEISKIQPMMDDIMEDIMLN